MSRERRKGGKQGGKQGGREGKRDIPSEAEARKRPLWLQRTLLTGAV